MSDRETIVSEGDKILRPWVDPMGVVTSDYDEYEVILFRGCLGIFETEQHKEMGRITPICNLYEAGPDSENKYMSNIGPYQTNLVPAFIVLAG